MDDAPRTRGPRRGLLAVAVAAALAAAGVGACADDPAPSRAAYAEAADRVCSDVDEELHDREVELWTAAAGEGDGPEADLYVERRERWVRVEVVPAYRDMDNRLRKIRAPEDDRTYLDDIYDDLRRLTDELHNRPSQGRDLIREDPEVRSRFEGYGMKVCGRV